MTHWLRVAAWLICRTPVLVVLIVSLCIWSSAAEIYAAMLQIPHRGESGAVVLGILDALCAGGLVFAFLTLARDLRELRIPMHRQLLAVLLTFIVAAVFVAPCVLVWSLKGSAYDLLIVTTGSITGCAAALLWGVRSRMRTSLPADRGAETMRPSGPLCRPTPWRALQVALGAPYAPASWQHRLIQVAALCAAVVAVPALLELFRGSLSAHAFSRALLIAQFVILVPAVALCWIWPLSRLPALFNPKGGAMTELALLPGAGSAGQQLRRLYLVSLSVPIAALAGMLIIAMGVARLEHQPNAVLVKLAVEFFLIPVVTLPALVGQLAKPCAGKILSAPVFMFSQAWLFTGVIWSGSWDALPYLPRWLFWLLIAIVAGALIGVGGVAIFPLRKLARRPHPFVEVTE